MTIRFPHCTISQTGIKRCKSTSISSNLLCFPGPYVVIHYTITRPPASERQHQINHNPHWLFCHHQSTIADGTRLISSEQHTSQYHEEISVKCHVNIPFALVLLVEKGFLFSWEGIWDIIWRHPSQMSWQQTKLFLLSWHAFSTVVHEVTIEILWPSFFI